MSAFTKRVDVDAEHHKAVKELTKGVSTDDIHPDTPPAPHKGNTAAWVTQSHGTDTWLQCPCSPWQV